jgi:hypothetical protein
MSETVSSIILGTAGLTLAFLAALVVAMRSPVPAREHASRLRPIAIASVVAQSLHFMEELTDQFYVRFPEIFGLGAWPATFFVVFNLSWLVIWSVAIVTITRFPRPSAIALWFLAMASIANGIVHPLLSVAARSYFPGLWTSVLVAILGVGLIRRLAAATRQPATPHGVT